MKNFSLRLFVFSLGILVIPFSTTFSALAPKISLEKGVIRNIQKIKRIKKELSLFQKKTYGSLKKNPWMYDAEQNQCRRSAPKVSKENTYDNKQECMIANNVSLKIRRKVPNIPVVSVNPGSLHLERKISRGKEIRRKTQVVETQTSAKKVIRNNQIIAYDKVTPSSFDTTEVTDTVSSFETSTGTVSLPAQRTVSQKVSTVSVTSEIDNTISITPRLSDVRAHKLTFTTNGNSAEISALSFTRIGQKGSYTDFLEAWIEINGKIASRKVSITNDRVTIPFDNPVFLGEKASQTFLLKVNVGNVPSGNSSRFVLFKPEDIQTNVLPIGFFPFGGYDLNS